MADACLVHGFAGDVEMALVVARNPKNQLALHGLKGVVTAHLPVQCAKALQQLF